MKKKQVEPLDDTTFKTTITFKGTAKNLVSRLGYSKSAVVNALITDAIKSGKIVDYLVEHFSDSSIDEMLNRSGSNKRHVEGSKTSEARQSTPSKQADNESAVRGSLKSENINTNQNKQKENSDGFDF